jgi:hypothetical protein
MHSGVDRVLRLPPESGTAESMAAYNAAVVKIKPKATGGVDLVVLFVPSRAGVL